MSKSCRVVLTGFMGAGKTTVGRLLAQMLSAEFCDLDELTAASAGATVAQIFAEQGETKFRRFEEHALKTWLADTVHQPRVLALGGGTVESSTAVELLTHAANTHVFYLAAPLEELVRRCESNSEVRPLLVHAPELYRRRTPLYETLGVTIQTAGLTPDAVAQQITDLLREQYA